MPTLWYPKPAFEELGTKEVVKLTFNSLRISKSHGLVQGAIEHYLGAAYYGQVTPDLLEDSRPAVESVIANHYLGPNHKDSDEGTDDEKIETVHNVVNSFFQKWHFQANRPQAHFNFEEFTCALLAGDLKWLPQNRKEKTPGSAKRDKPYRSQLLHYGVLERKTGVKDYDAMYRLAAAQMSEWVELAADGDDVPAIFEQRVGSVVLAHVKANKGDRTELAERIPSLMPIRKFLFMQHPAKLKRYDRAHA